MNHCLDKIRTIDLKYTYSFFLILIVVFIAYSNSINAPFYHDDYGYLIGNKAIEISSLNFTELKKAALESPLDTRWLPNISFALNHYFLGAKPKGYRVINIIFHILTSFVVFLLFQSTLKLSAKKSLRPKHFEIALLGTLLWALHPLQVNCVTYVVQRMTNMAAFFFLSSMLLYIYGRLSSVFRGRLICYSLSLFSGMCAIVCKEISAVLPLMIVAYEFFFLRKINWRERYISIGVMAVIVTVLLLAITQFYLGGSFNILAGYHGRDFTLFERLLTQSRVVVFYLSLIVLPLPSRLNLLHDVPLSTSFFNPPQTILSIIFILFCLVSIYLLYKRDSRILAFAIFWYFGNLVIESSVIPLEIIYEHRTYLPSIFLILAACSYIYQILEVNKKLPLYVLCLCILLFAIVTWQRNLVWANTDVFFRDVIKKSPNLSRGYLAMYFSLRSQGKNSEARSYLEKAIAVSPFNEESVINMARLDISERSYGEALKVLNLYLSNKRSSQVLQLRAIVNGYMKNYLKAEKDAESLLIENPSSSSALLIKGTAQYYQGKYDMAMANFQKLLDKGAKTATLFSAIGNIYLNLGNVDKAIYYYSEALKINPDHAQSNYNLGRAYGRKGMRKKSAKYMNIGSELLKHPKSIPLSIHGDLLSGD